MASHEAAALQASIASAIVIIAGGTHHARRASSQLHLYNCISGDWGSRMAWVEVGEVRMVV